MKNGFWVLSVVYFKFRSSMLFSSSKKSKEVHNEPDRQIREHLGQGAGRTRSSMPWNLARLGRRPQAVSRSTIHKRRTVCGLRLSTYSPCQPSSKQKGSHRLYKMQFRGREKLPDVCTVLSWPKRCGQTLGHQDVARVSHQIP